jgi:hypothetical protein
MKTNKIPSIITAVVVSIFLVANTYSFSLVKTGYIFHSGELNVLTKMGAAQHTPAIQNCLDDSSVTKGTFNTCPVLTDSTFCCRCIWKLSSVKNCVSHINASIYESGKCAICNKELHLIDENRIIFGSLESPRDECNDAGKCKEKGSCKMVQNENEICISSAGCKMIKVIKAKTVEGIDMNKKSNKK